MAELAAPAWPTPKSKTSRVKFWTPVPNGPSQYAEAQKIARLGDVEGRYTLQQF